MELLPSTEEADLQEDSRSYIVRFHLKITNVYIYQVWSTFNILIDVVIDKVCALALCNRVIYTVAYSTV